METIESFKARLEAQLKAASYPSWFIIEFRNLEIKSYIKTQEDLNQLIGEVDSMVAELNNLDSDEGEYKL